MIYVAFASNCDLGNYHGWVLAYDALTLAQRAVFNPTRNGSAGGIWQSGKRPRGDELRKDLYWDRQRPFDGTTDCGDSFVKLDPMLHVVDYFTPSNEYTLDVTDQDAGITGVVLLRAQTYEAMGGVKSGRFYLLSRGPMGKFCSICDDSQAPGILDLTTPIFDVPAYAVGKVYIGAVGARLRAWQIVNGRLSASAVARSANSFRYPGTSPSISSEAGLHPVVWALDVSGNVEDDPAVLHAYRADDLTETTTARRRARATLPDRASSSPFRPWPAARSMSARKPNSTFTASCPPDFLFGRARLRRSSQRRGSEPVFDWHAGTWDRGYGRGISIVRVRPGPQNATANGFAKEVRSS